jgi:hypothetical protein
MVENRELTKRLLASATSWLEAARTLLHSTKDEVLLWAPIYTMLFYTLEQSLKAYLASRGATRADVIGFGHRLKDLASSAKQQGLELGEGRFVELLAQLDGKLLELRYLEGEGIEVAEPDEALELVDDYFQIVARAIDVDALIDPDHA